MNYYKPFLPILTLAALLVLGVALPGTAQNKMQRNNIEIFGSGYQYSGDISSQYWSTNMTFGGGVAYNRYLSRIFDGSIHLGYGKIDSHIRGSNPYESNESKIRAGGYYEGSMGTALIGAKLKLHGLKMLIHGGEKDKNGLIMKNEEPKLGPYILTSFGANFVRTEGETRLREPTSTRMTTPVLLVALGFKYNINEKLGVFYQFGQHYTFSDAYDGIAGGTKNDTYFHHMLGLSLNLGKKDELPCP
ncbi:hypothetical protein [Pontibacter sp. SGAir0037]|uniref:hypothetical protein n=1 Tax=Pontibacter sp. SGAir0037 TaxID=2571030 RepID=UPI0010CD58CC|nr:hypothetical protein [Pontibacter sp. SGAir0037]QCR24783.1 hypothetical protein C1N53_22120 [Pontibacter sp. SGAir0037]